MPIIWTFNFEFHCPLKIVIELIELLATSPDGSIFF